MVMRNDQVSSAGSVLTQLRAQLTQATAALARACAKDELLQADRLDAWQVASFEVAWAAADLLAAETVIEQIDDSTAAFDIQLALIFAADAANAVRDRLEWLFLELDLDVEPLCALTSGQGWTHLRRHGASAAVLKTVGAELGNKDDDEIGRVMLDEALLLARDSFRKFAAGLVAPLAEPIHRDNLTVPDSLLQGMRAMGAFGLSVPEKYGGAAVAGHEDAQLMVAVTEALSQASLAAAGSLITRPEILTRALLAGGTEEQKQLWLPRIASGELLCAIAITEPDYGSDVASLSLKATPTEGGWLLDGAKTWCTFAGKADLLMVVARTDPDRANGHRGLSILIVEKPSYSEHAFVYDQAGGGRLTGRAIPTIGYRGMHSFDLAFERFFVPGPNLIGGECGVGKGFYFTMAGMMGGRMQTAARATGVMRAALRAALVYAGDRKVFGGPLFDYPLTLAKLARMAARLAACRQLAFAVAKRLDEKNGAIEASLVKLLACRSAELVTREAMQIHGGMGYAEETAVSRYFVDARVLSIFEGAEETLALKVIARGLFESALAKA